MVNDKNHLFTPADVTKDRKTINKILTQQQFSRFSISAATALNLASDTPAPMALQIQTKPNVGDPINDTIGSIGLITQIIFLDVFGSNYSTMTITDDVEFAFDKIPEGRHILFTLDMLIDTGTPPTITLDPRVENLPTLPTLTDGLRVILHFEGVADETNTRFVYIGGTVDAAGASPSQIIDGNTTATVLDSAPSFVVKLNGIQKYSISNTRIDLEDLDVFGVETLFFNDDVGSPTMVSMGNVATGVFDINVINATDIFNIQFAGDDSARFTDGRFQLFSSAPNTLSASMSMFRDDPSPSPADALADIDFDGRDSAANFTTYASILGGIEVATSGAERGRITFQVTQNGALQQRMRVAIDEIEINNAPLQFDEISLPSNPAANKGLIYLRDVGAVTTPFFLDSSGTESSLIGAGAANQIIDGNTSATVLDSAPSFVVLLNGIQKFSIQDTRIDYANLDLHGVDIINFDDTASTLMAQIGGTSTQFFDINVISTSSIFRVLFAGDESARFTDGRLQLFSATPNTLSAGMSFFRDDPSPTAADALADIDFDGNDSVGNFTTYVSLLGGIESPTSASELGRFTVQVAGGSGSGGALVQVARINFGSIELNDMYVELDEISLPANPAANQGKLYLRDVAAVTTLFFLDSAGTETDLLAGGFSAGDTHTWTALQTFDVGTGAEGILMSDGTKIEFEDGAVTNLEMRAIESGLRDPGDMTITTRPGLEIDINTGAIPDTEVFHIGDGVANPWFLIDDTTVRFNSGQTGATGHQMFLSRDNIPTDGQDISEIFAQTKIGASTWLKFAFIRFTALDVEASAVNNEGQMRLGVVSNNTLNTAINIEGLAGVSDVKIGFFSGTTPVGQQQLDADPTNAEISTALRNLGLTKL